MSAQTTGDFITMNVTGDIPVDLNQGKYRTPVCGPGEVTPNTENMTPLHLEKNDPGVFHAVNGALRRNLRPGGSISKTANNQGV